MRCRRFETQGPVIPFQLAACLRMQMHRGGQAARHGDQVTIHMNGITDDLGGPLVDRADLDAGHTLAAMGKRDRMPGHDHDS